jgi:hypothetical protein
MEALVADGSKLAFGVTLRSALAERFVWVAHD